ncbi:winged helix family transcriptional regulator, partial [Candidatus Nomurabacteria bacterium]|nr:winged helix family transcriptional regulator [Candidatus Nomurabacteria bacterium]
KQVSIDNKNILLTKKEYEILFMLVSSPHRFFSRQEILDAVWENEVYVLDRTVDVHIARLRKKLDNYGALIINRSGFGYCFNLNETD